MKLDNIIRKPIITEKSLKDATEGIFTFETDLKATKQQIKKTIEEMFAVHVRGITTNIVKGKKRVSGKKRITFSTSDKKKARVKLNPGETIDIFEVSKQT